MLLTEAPSNWNATPQPRIQEFHYTDQEQIWLESQEDLLTPTPLGICVM